MEPGLFPYRLFEGYDANEIDTEIEISETHKGQVWVRLEVFGEGVE